MYETAVVLMSGGIDSAVSMAIACAQHDEVIPIHFNYGQQTAELEREMAYKQCVNLANEYPHCRVPKTPVVRYGQVFKHFAEGVADSDKDFGGLLESDGRSSGYVPVRNLHFIATGAAIADHNGAEFVYHGAQGGDEADYPDCRPGFMKAADKAISRSVPDDQELVLVTPLLDLDKSTVIKRGQQFGVDFSHTYSCYTEVEDVNDPTPCGECPACLERAEAFERAGVEDPHGTEVTA